VVREETEVDLMSGEPISLGMVRTIRREAKRHKARVVWGEDGLLRLYFESGRKLTARSEDDAREIREAMESGEVNPPAFKKPYRVETWFERDRKSIVVYDANDREIAEWWDDDVDVMVESGYFDTSGFIMGREARKGRLEDSVLGYVKELGLDMPAGLDRAAKMRRVAAKRQGKNPPDHPIHLSSAPHWGYTMGELAAATRHLKSLQLHFTPEEIERETKISPLIQSSILRGGSVYSGAPEALSKMYHEKVSQNNPPLPASALMDISTAKTVVREVDSGARTPRPALSQADDLLDRGLQKLRGSHLGNVDWSNPPKRWRYEDARGVKREGIFLDFRDYGGTDVTYFFRRDDGAVDLVSGSRLKLASPIYEKENPPGALSTSEKVLLSAFKAQGRLSMRDIPGHYSESVADLVGRNLIRPVPGMKWRWELTPAGRREKENPPEWGTMELHRGMKVIGTARLPERVVQHKGWQSITYSGKRYQLFGGVRGGYFINLGRPITRQSLPEFFEKENPPATEVYRNIIEIRAEKKNGERFVHKFGRGSSIYGLPNGNILIASRSGKKLWKNFNTKG
jgi:hypothetical protein